MNEEIVRLYIEGVSENALAKQFGTTRYIIGKTLREAGVKRRTQSESEAMKWSKMSPQQRQQQVKAAHDKVRGTKRSKEELLQRAMTRQENPTLSNLEQQFLKMFKKYGVDVVSQYALETYNLDFAIPRDKIAIEIDGGNWHDSIPKRKFDRGKEVLLVNRGWKLIRVKVNRGYITVSTNINKECFVPILQAIYSNPSIWC